MSLIARALTSQFRVYDLSAKLSESEVQAMVAAVAPAPLALYRYVFFGPPKPSDLDAAELIMLLKYAVVLVVVHVPFEGWIPSASLGTDHSGAAIANCIRAGYVTPTGCNPLALGIDVEDCVRGGDSVGYVRSCSDARIQHTYAPDLYTGFASGLKSADVTQLCADYTTMSTWCDFANMAQRPAPARGFDAHQGAQIRLAGLDADPDTILHDNVIYGLCSADLYIPVNDAAAGSGSDAAA
jgi:hypothetical protein